MHTHISLSKICRNLTSTIEPTTMVRLRTWDLKECLYFISHTLTEKAVCTHDCERRSKDNKNSINAIVSQNAEIRPQVIDTETYISLKVSQ